MPPSAMSRAASCARRRRRSRVRVSACWRAWCMARSPDETGLDCTALRRRGAVTSEDVEGLFARHLVLGAVVDEGLHAFEVFGLHPFEDAAGAVGNQLP